MLQGGKKDFQFDPSMTAHFSSPAPLLWPIRWINLCGVLVGSWLTMSWSWPSTQLPGNESTCVCLWTEGVPMPDSEVESGANDTSCGSTTSAWETMGAENVNEVRTSSAHLLLY